MAIYKNKQLYVLNESSMYEPFHTVNNEIFLTSDLIASGYSEIFYYGGKEYINAIMSPISVSVIKIHILNKDETFHKDISEYVSDWNLNFAYKQGATRSGNLTLMNYNNEWSPSPVNDTIWKCTKFRIYIGIYYNQVIYWRDCGIFVSGNISVDYENGTVSFPLYDKFALLDGTVGGKRNYTFKIPVGTSLRESIRLCLNEQKIQSKSEVFDSKPFIFPLGMTNWNGVNMLYSTINTPYTITKDPNGNMGDIITELANMVSLDVYYNNDGNLTLTPGAVTNDDLKDRSVLWNYEDNKNQYASPSYEIDYENLVSEVIVAGAIENGKQYKGITTNTSPTSQMNQYLTEPNPLYIEDTNLIGDTACQTRSKYEMIKQGRLGIQLKFKSIFIPHLECNNLIFFNNSKMGFTNEKFIINSIGVSQDMLMNISASSIEEVSF